MLSLTNPCSCYLKIPINTTTAQFEHFQYFFSSLPLASMLFFSANTAQTKKKIIHRTQTKRMIYFFHIIIEL